MDAHASDAYADCLRGSSDGRIAVCACGPGQISSFDVFRRCIGSSTPEFKLIVEIRDQGENYGDHYSLSPDGKLLMSVVSGNWRNPKVVNTERSSFVRELQADAAAPYSYGTGFSRDGRLAITLALPFNEEFRPNDPDAPAIATFWDTRTWEAVRKLELPIPSFGDDILFPCGNLLSLSRDGRWFAFVGGNGNVHVLDLRTGREAVRLSEHLGTANCVAFSDDDRLLATGGDDTTAVLWDVHELTQAGESKNPTARCRCDSRRRLRGRR